MVLNAIHWTAKLDPPAEGVQCEITVEDLARKLDDKGQRKKK